MCLSAVHHIAEVAIPLCNFVSYIKAETASKLGASGMSQMGRCAFQHAPSFTVA